MGKVYWSVVVLVIIVGISAAIYFGLQGRTVPLIKWSHFANASEVSGAIEKRMQQELRPFQFYFLGPHPKKPLHVQSVVNLAYWLRQKESAIIIVDKIMSEENPQLLELRPELVIDIAKEKERFVTGVQNMPREQKAVVIAPNIYVTHLLQQSPINEMQQELKDKKYIVMSFFNFPRSREQEKDFEFPCNTSESSASQLDLGCFILGQSRRFYVKSDVESKTPGFLNLVRTHEYMFFLGQ